MKQPTSYKYFKNAPSKEEYQAECINLLNNIHYFDGLRGDRSISSAGLEARVPFAEKEFLEYYLKIIPELKMFNDTKIEKYLIRKAFDDGETLPQEVLWRKKDGFSDSVSNSTRTWYQIIEEYIETIITDEEFEIKKNNYKWNKPLTKEALYYRLIFDKHYGDHLKYVIPYFWMLKGREMSSIKYIIIIIVDRFCFCTRFFLWCFMSFKM